MNPWPHQTAAVAATIAAIDDGKQRICLTSPTGGGKSLIAQLVMTEFLRRDLPVVMYTNRKMLREQLSRTFAKAGFDHGIRAAGERSHSDYLLQISSIQTEQSRVVKRKTWELHPAKLVVVDEAHLQKGDMAGGILAEHEKQGAVILGMTATPLDLGDTYQHLVVAGKNSELRKCGALVPAMHYGPDEPDLKGIKGAEDGDDLTEGENRKAIMREGIFGRVLEAFQRLNPAGKPTILFAPGVGESLWFAQQFSEAGVKACHIDGKDIWIDGDVQPTSEDLREEIAKRSRGGTLTVICNRFVMREGIDFKWIEHIILATVFGSLQSYLQSGGRGLRASPESGKRRLIVQDHGGNWWRHGSLNEDRYWNLDLTSAIVTGERLDALRNKELDTPFRCPKCGCILAVKVCVCGFEIQRKTCPRVVVQSDGTLKQMSADPLRPRSISKNPSLIPAWCRMYWRSRTEKGWRRFKAAAALFAKENHWQWPNPNWPLMPRPEFPRDWYRHVADVPFDRLTSVPERKNGQDTQEEEQAGLFAGNGTSGDPAD